MAQKKDKKVDVKPPGQITFQEARDTINKEQERLYKETKGEIVPIKQIQNGQLICFKSDEDKIHTGYAFIIGGVFRVVLKENKKRTTLAGRDVWVVKHGTPSTKKSIEEVNSKDFETIKESEILDKYVDEDTESGEEVSPQFVEKGIFICFCNKKDIAFCGYAFPNGSNLRVACSDKEIRGLKPYQKVWRSKKYSPTKKKFTDSFDDTDFGYDEDAFKVDANEAFKFNKILESINELETIIKTLQLRK